MSRPINQAGLDIITRFEGLRLTAYQDSAGIWTIGYGNTSHATPGMVITEDEALAYLHEDLGWAQNAVDSSTHDCATNDNQYSAMVSLCFNIGARGFKGSSVLRLHRLGQFDEAASAFMLWDRAHVDGQLIVLAGLKRRRAAEAALYAT